MAKKYLSEKIKKLLVKLIIENDISISEISEQLKISDSALRRWKQEYQSLYRQSKPEENDALSNTILMKDLKEIKTALEELNETVKQVSSSNHFKDDINFLKRIIESVLIKPEKV
jgi:transposase-like protein